jgi:Mn2+/Fe2+ NRAMP family transporter
MGAQVNRRLTTILSWSCAIVIVVMNVFLLCQQFFLS